MKKAYNKLVRDKIPEIIEADNCTSVTSKLKVAEFKKALMTKLLEESAEVVEAKNKKELVKELADLQEVLLSIYEVYKIECSEVTKTAAKRRKERGGFKKRIFLESVTPNK